jgi:hypothetical protein
MIQPLRNCHRWSFLLLAVLLPVLFVAGLLVRPNPFKLRVATQFIAPQGSDWQKHSFAVQISTTPTGERALMLVPTKPILAPDLLVYYSDHAPLQGVLPDDAHLLGRWDAGFSYSLPRPLNGFVLLYSGAQKAVLDSVAVEGHP